MTAPSASESKDIEHYTQLDQRLVAAVKDIRVLASVNWPVQLAGRIPGRLARRQPGAAADPVPKA